MEYIKNDKAKFYEGEGFFGMDYPLLDKDINFAIIKVQGKSPHVGYQENTACKELLYILDGSGVLYIKNREKMVPFQSGDVVLINKEEKYRFEGQFEACVSCTPAWTSEQHLYSKE